MLRTTKVKPEKINIKAVFRLQFHATHIPQRGWDKLSVSFVPAESGKVTARTKKANVRSGSCKWADPIYETTRLIQDSKTRICEDRFYKVVVAMGLSRSGILGEAEINLAGFYEASRPVNLTLPLHGLVSGVVLHVTVQLLTSKTGFREFERQSEVRERSLAENNDYCDDDDDYSSLVESPSSDDPFGLHTHKMGENSNLKECLESEIRSNASNFSPQSFPSGSPKNTSSGIHSGESVARSSGRNQNEQLKSLDVAESSLSDLRRQVSSLESSVGDIGNDAHKFEQHLASELASSVALSKQVLSLKFECSNVKSGLKALELSKQSSGTILEGLDSVEKGLRELHGKALFADDDISASFCLDIDALLDTLRGLRIGFERSGLPPPGNAVLKPVMEAEVLQLHVKLGESEAQQGILESRMHNLEQDFERFVHETAERQKKMAAESQILRHEHSACIHAVSSGRSELEEANRCVSGLLAERNGLVSDNRSGRPEPVLEAEMLRLQAKLSESEAEQGILESRIHDLEQDFERFVHETVERQKKMATESQSLRHEHSACIQMVSSGRSEVEEANRRVSRLLAERDVLVSENGVLKRRAEAARERYSISIEQLQSDLDLLSSQVSSILESEFSNPSSRFEWTTEPGLRSSRIAKIERLEQRIPQLKEFRVGELVEVLDATVQKIGHMHEAGDDYFEQNSKFLHEIERLSLEMGVFFEPMSGLLAENREMEEMLEADAGEAIYGAVMLDLLTEKLGLLDEDLTRERRRREKAEGECARFEKSLLEFEKGNRKTEEEVQEMMSRCILLEVRGMLLESGRFESRSGRVRGEAAGAVRESLKVALMKEKYETRVQELEQRLLDSRMHGEETLLRLQEAADEVERRKKAEASGTREKDELLVMLRSAIHERDGMSAEAEGSSRRLEACEREKEALEVHLRRCGEELFRMRGVTCRLPDVTSAEQESESVGGMGREEQAAEEEDDELGFAGEYNSEAQCLKSTMDRIHAQLEMMRIENYSADADSALLLLNEENEEVGPTHDGKTCSGGEHVLERVAALETRLALAINYSSGREEEEEGRGVERELAEMRERYSQLSLMFAEVEGERQRLVMTVKNLKPPPPLLPL